MSRRTLVNLSRIALALSVLAGACTARADVRLPAILSDHMVLQVGVPSNVWGWADAGEPITVTLGAAEQKTTADSSGNWSVTFDKHPADKQGDDKHGADRQGAGKRLTLVVTGKNRVTVHDVLMGEVWLCSGQSNMGVPVDRSIGGVQAAAEADYPEIRFFTVQLAGTLEPASDVRGAWVVCSPKIAAHQTAVGFYFGRELHRHLHVPVGLVNSSVGGSPIEGWMPREQLDTLAELRPATAARVNVMQSRADAIARFPALCEQWEVRHGVQPPPNEGESRGWANAGFDDRAWPQTAFPARWEQAAGVKTGGVFWLRKTVTLPAEAAGKPFSLVLNFMHEQYDTTYFNGKQVGHSGDAAPDFYLAARRYEVPGKLVVAGKNVIAVRVVAANPRSELLGRGFRGDYNLPVDQHQVGNEWRVHVESLFPPLSAEALKSRPRPNDASLVNTPTILYNAMIRPLTRYAIRGVVWYQGESNASRAQLYSREFPLMIEIWRREWKLGDFPFYFVQLANYLDPPADPNQRSTWAELREAQAEALATVLHTGMAVTIDVGDRDNIHPANKLDVGRRLARVALAQTYGEKIEDVGPRFRSMQIEGSHVRIAFEHAAGLTAGGTAPKAFAIAGDDRRFVWADARIDGEDVILSSPRVVRPVAVRYAWADNPGELNLYSAAGLPAEPFRTDRWPPPTQ